MKRIVFLLLMLIAPALSFGEGLPHIDGEVGEKDELLALLEEVERLKGEVVSTKRETLSTKSIKDAKSVGSKTVYTFQEGEIYEVNCGVEKVTDIRLQAGESLTGEPVAGDTVRWKIGLLQSGEGKNETTHVIIKPLEPGVETNIILTTTKRVYHLKVTSGKWYMPTVSFRYPEDELRIVKGKIKQKKIEQKVAVLPTELNFDYKLRGKGHYWKPVRVFDDGSKTYIQIPKGVKVQEAPVLLLVDAEGGTVLSNYRVKGDYYIVDRLFERAELRVGKKSKLKIISDRYNGSFWDIF